MPASKPPRDPKNGPATSDAAPKGATPEGATPEAERPDGERIAKRLARAGVCSRRDAEKLILAGRVAVDGRVLDSPALVVTASQLVTVDGKPVGAPEAPRLWRYHKPDGLITTHKDPQGRPTLFERLPPELPRVISIGRLDLNSEGLLLLTNDGGLARRLELPSTAWIRRYRVRVYGTIADSHLQALEQGITVDGVRYGSIQATIDQSKGANSWLSMSLREGKNREIRRVIEYLGGKVTRLIRVGYGPFELGDLPRGAVDEVAPKILRTQLGGLLTGAESTAKKSPSDQRRADRREAERKSAESKGKDADADRRRPA